MRKCLFAVVAALVALTTFIAATGGLSAGVEPVGAEEAEELLAAVRLASDAAASRVSRSAGTVRVHEWIWRATGEVLETETVYAVALAGEKFKAAVTTTYVTNEWTPAHPGAGFNAPGTVQRGEIAYDGEKITSYEPDRNRAEISRLESDAGRQLKLTRVVVMSPGHGVPELKQVALPPGYEWDEPRVVGREVVDGEECIVYNSSYTGSGSDGAEVTYYNVMWLNPQRACTLSKGESGIRAGRFGEGVLLTQAETETRQYAEGLWGVREVRQTQYALDDSGTRYRQRYAVTTFAEDYQLKAPVTEEMLTIDVPSGTKVYDELIDAEYTVP